MGLRALTGFGALASIIAVAACATPTEAPIETPRMASPTPAMTLLEETAARYVVLRSDIEHIQTNRAENASGMRDAHLRLASFDPNQMAGSWVAYAALVAADTPAFADAIAAATDTQQEREAFLRTLRDNPASVRSLPGANEAMRSIREVAARDATRIHALGERFIDDAYAMQKVGWATQKIPQNGSMRVRSAVDYASSRVVPPYRISSHQFTTGGTIRPNLMAANAWTPAWSADTVPAKAAPRSGTMMTRALVLAARYATGDLQPTHLANYAKSKTSKRCFVNAKLNLDQCIAATRTPYEEAFCLGEHGLNDVSYCVGWVASAGRIKD